MKHFRFMALVAAQLVLLLLGVPPAFAQAPSPSRGLVIPTLPPVAHAKVVVTEIPTPDSAVWRAFYDNHRPATEMQDFLVLTFGLTSSDAATVITAGQQYVSQLAAIDDATNAEIRTRFKPAFLPSNLTQIAQSAGLAPPPPSAAIGGLMADGRTVQDAMKADGLPVRAQRQRDAALQVHQAQLRQTIGPQKFMALQAWMNANIVPGMKTFDVTPPVPAPLTSRVTVLSPTK